MRFTITRHGVPVGTVNFGGTQPAVGLRVRPLAGYSAIREVVRDATTALAGIQPGQGSAPADIEALERGTELGQQLELRDIAGMQVPVDFIVLTEWPGIVPLVAATFQLRDAPALVPARLPQRPRDGGSESDAPPA